MRFVGIDNVGRDMLNTHTMLYTTPRLLDYLGQRGRKRMYDQSWGWLTRRRQTPMGIDFPISLDPEHNNWFHSRIEQINVHEAQMHAETPVDTNTTWPFLMATPLGPVRGTLRALSNEPATFHASPQSDFFGPCVIIGASGSAIHVEYQNGRRALLSLLPVERAHKGAIPAALLLKWRDGKEGAA